MDLPGGAQVLIAALIVGGQANLGKSLLKWRLRLLGVVTGAVYGFGAMVIVSFFPHFPVMLCLLLIGVFIGSYVAMGDDRYSYAGLQMALVCPLVLVYEAGPPIGLGEVESRFWGALLGGVAVTVLGHFSVARRSYTRVAGPLWDNGKTMRGALSSFIGTRTRNP